MHGGINKVTSKRFTRVSGTCSIPFALLPGNGGIARYFIDIESRGAILEAACFSVDIERDNLRPTIYLIRTFGNTVGVINSLKRFCDDRFWAHMPESRDILFSHSMFCVYDSTPDAARHLANEITKLNLNSCAWIGPNLGGGGNASVNLYLAKGYSEDWNIKTLGNQSKCDYVILDDDVCASPETLYRVFALNQLKKPSVTFGSPIFMQSDPQRLWENGGHWGKEYSRGEANLTSVTPQLSDHGLYFSKYEHLNTIMNGKNIDYTTFNLFSFSSETQSAIGYPAAFFLRGDDIDYSLRCKKNGQLKTSLNLAVWQEPAHSYWQEYMAFMHGLIINIIHGEWTISQIKSQLKIKILEHALHADLFGLDLYSMIISDLAASDLLLSEKFANLYLMRKRELSRYESKFSSSLDPYNSARKNQIQTINFVHPSIAPDYSKPLVALFWPSKKAYYIYERSNQATNTRITEMVIKALNEMMDWDNMSLNITNSIKARYLITTQEAFWAKLLAQHEHELVCSSEYQRKDIQETSSIDQNLQIDEDYSDIFTTSSFTSTDRAIIEEMFDPDKYLELNPDVATANIGPLEHYIKYGIKEGRSII